MIPDKTLRYLVVHRIRDAESLLKNSRYPAAVYMAGYAVEVALKRKICKTFHFNAGFPENSDELFDYLVFINWNNARPIQLAITDIKNHDLHKLLYHSGAEQRIRTRCSADWKVVARWTPKYRYKKYHIRSRTANKYIQAVKKIVKEINLNLYYEKGE